MQELPNDQQCPHCGRFANRGLTIDTVIVKDDEILLVKRGVDPFKGYWATPGGYVEWDESTEEAVAREVKEETRLVVTGTELVGVRSIPERHPKQTITLLYKATVADKNALKGDDAEEVRWFKFDEIPEVLAFDHRQNIKDALGI